MAKVLQDLWLTSAMVSVATHYCIKQAFTLIDFDHLNIQRQIFRDRTSLLNFFLTFQTPKTRCQSHNINREKIGTYI